MASPSIAPPAPRRRPPALWIWTACLCAAIFVDVVFAWEVNSSAAGIGLLFTWGLPFAVLLTLVWGIVFAFRRRPQWRMILAGLFAPVLCILVWFASSQLLDQRITWDFEHNLSAREQVVQMVVAGKLADDNRYSGNTDAHHHMLLPRESAHLAHLDGDVVVHRDPASHAMQQVWFLEERPCPDCERGFVYDAGENFDGYNGMYQVTPLRPHWYWAVEVR